MITREKALINLAELDRSRASALDLVNSNHPLASLAVQVCDTGDNYCISILNLYRHIDNYPEDKEKMMNKYNSEIEPLIKKHRSLSRLLSEECSKALKEK